MVLLLGREGFPRRVGVRGGACCGVVLAAATTAQGPTGVAGRTVYVPMPPLPAVDAGRVGRCGGAVGVSPPTPALVDSRTLLAVSCLTTVRRRWDPRERVVVVAQRDRACCAHDSPTPPTTTLTATSSSRAIVAVARCVSSTPVSGVDTLRV